MNQLNENTGPAESNAAVSLPAEEIGIADELEPTSGATASEGGSLVALLQEEARSRRQDEVTTLAWSTAFILMTVMAARTFTDAQSMERSLGICLVLMITLGAGICAHFYRRSYRRKQSLSAALGQIHDVSQIGPLVQTLRVQNTPVRNLAKSELTRLLPTVQASDAQLLGAWERSVLMKELGISPSDLGRRDLSELFSRHAERRETEFRKAVLKAYEQVGGSMELQTVERLSRGITQPSSGARVPAQIQEAARECLPYLRIRAGEQTAQEQLLRASGEMALPGETLLRANVRGEARIEKAAGVSEG